MRTTGTTGEDLAAADPARGSGRALDALRPTSVRSRIATTIALVTAVAMASAGALVYLLEDARISRAVAQQVEQEVAELHQLEGGVDPSTGRRFATAEALLFLYLARNVTADDEMLVAYVEGRSPRISPHRWGQALLGEPAYRAGVERVLAQGGTEELTTPTTGQLWVTAVPVQQPDEAGSTAALVIVNFVGVERRELRRTMQTYAAVTMGFLLLITLFALWRAGSLLAPLTTLRRTAEDIGETDLGRRIPERGHDDITALTRTLNAMLDRLEDSFAGQRRFLDDAGHELRTPLTVVRGHLELLEAGDPAEVDATRLLLLDEVDRMSRLVGDLILLAKSDRPDFVDARPVRTGVLLAALLSKARGLADRRWVLDEEVDVVVTMDEQRVTQAVLQLVENAVKHTGPGDVVALGARVVPGHLELWVRDTGPGVAPEDRHLVFERFGRGSEPVGNDGVGLGLSIVSAIAEAHGGDVRLEDTAGPSGACFVLRLPVGSETPWPGS